MTIRDTSLGGAMERLRRLARGDATATMSVEAHLAEAERQLRLAGEGTAPGAPFLPIQTRVGVAQQHLAWAQLLRERELALQCADDDLRSGDFFEEDEPVERLVGAFEAGTPAVSARPLDVIEGSGVAGPRDAGRDAWWTILEGVVGSQAYGLATSASDEDALAVALAPTSTLLGLRPLAGHAATRVRHDPDHTTHELGKALQLLLSCNPSAMELLWLPADLYRVRTATGDDLARLRGAFLSRARVRDVYLGYASGQLRRLSRRDPDDADALAKTAKNARHLWRLLVQGHELYATGRLMVRLEADDAATCREFGVRVAGGDLDLARDELARFEGQFDATRSPLPERPDEGAVESWLRRARRAALRREDEGRWP